MIIRNADVSLVNCPDINDVHWNIETAGRVCYKSEDKMTMTSHIKFIKGIIARGHEAVLEHGTFYFELNHRTYDDFMMTIRDLMLDGWICHFKFTMSKSSPYYHVSGNVRNWREFISRCRMVPEYMKHFIFSYPVLFPEYQMGGPVFRTVYDGPYYFIEISPSDLGGDEFPIHYRQMVRFICDRGVSHELVRHRAASFCQESTRYCNYSKEQFGEEISVIAPCFWDKCSVDYTWWEESCKKAEEYYFDLIIEGCSPQQARAVLPNSLKTEVIMTCSLAEWDEFLKLRTSPAAHPQMREVAWMLQAALRDRYPKLYGKEVEEDEP